MSVNSVTATGRVVLPATAERVPIESNKAKKVQADALVRVDQATQQPIPPRFPWLSRLAQQLEPVSKQPSPYGSAPPLGEKVNQQA